MLKGISRRGEGGGGAGEAIGGGIECQKREREKE